METFNHSLHIGVVQEMVILAPVHSVSVYPMDQKYQLMGFITELPGKSLIPITIYDRYQI